MEKGSRKFEGEVRVVILELSGKISLNSLKYNAHIAIL